MARIGRVFLAAGAFCAALGFAQAAFAAGERIAVLTPYLSAVATAEMIDTFKAEAEARQWTVDVVDTAGDLGALASRIEDVVAAQSDAVVTVAPDAAQLQDQVDRHA